MSVSVCDVFGVANGLCEVTHTICIIRNIQRDARSEYELELTWWFCRFCIAPVVPFWLAHRLRFIFRTQMHQHSYTNTQPKYVHIHTHIILANVHTAYVCSFVHSFGYLPSLSIIFSTLLASYSLLYATYCWLALSPHCFSVQNVHFTASALWNECSKANFS